MEVYAPFLKNLLDYASFQKMNTLALKGRMASPDIDLNDSEAVVAAEDYVIVLEKIIEHAKSSYCGLSIGAFLNLSSLGLVLEISLRTSSLKQGIYILEKYLKHKFPIVSFAIVKDSNSYALRLESSVENKEVKRELLNMVLYIIYRELKLMLPNGQAPQIRLPFIKNGEISLFFKEKVFYSPDHLLILPENYDELEINSNRVKGIELLLPKFVSMLNESGRHAEGFSKNVKGMVLHMCDPEIPNFRQVQKQFACSERTFQRRLKAEGTSFRKITNAIKKELSYYLSNEKHLKTKDIAYILGYSESSAYLHAIKEWNNKSK